MKQTLDNWQQTVINAQCMAIHLSQLGVTSDILPSENYILAGCLALQQAEAVERLRNELSPHDVQRLQEVGVLGRHVSLSELPTGSVMMLHSVSKRLDQVIEHLEQILERAHNHPLGPNAPSTPEHPVIRVGSNDITGHKYQEAILHVRLQRTDRILITSSEGHVPPRLLVSPPQSIRISLPIVATNMMLYAENAIGATVEYIQFNEVAYG